MATNFPEQTAIMMDYPQYSNKGNIKDKLALFRFDPQHSHQMIAAALAHECASDRAKALKELHQSWIAEMRQAHSCRPHTRALDLCRELSLRIDSLLTQLAENSLTTQNARAIDFCIIALGGYGRAEMYPHSDIDLLILSETPTQQKTLETELQNLLYPLWDLGFQVGNTIQSSKSALQFAQKDHAFASALCEMRFLYGNQAYFDAFQTKYRKKVSRKQYKKRFLLEKFLEKKQRIQKQSHERSILEPNLKEGEGTLRDIHYIRWVSETVCGDVNPIRAGLWDQATQTLFDHAYKQMAEFRLAINFFVHHNEHRLLQNLQPDISNHLGYRHKGPLRPIERMMKHYFFVRSRIMLLGRLVEQKLTEMGYLPQQSKAICALPTTVSKAEDLLNYLQICCDQNADPDSRGLHALLHAKRLFLGLTPNQKSRNQALIRALICIPTTAEKFTRIAFLLHHTGILGRILPEYQHISGLTQTDGYHVYPVGLHTLKLLEYLHGMSEARSDSPHTTIDALLIQQGCPEEIFFAALLHDIAKGMGGQHAKRGGEIARIRAPEWGFTKTQSQTIVWLVHSHLLLSNLALHRDILDVGTTESLVKRTPDKRALDLLYCLTTADIRAVAGHSWNTWKAAVISRLYESAQKLLLPEATPIERERERTFAIAALREALPEMPDTVFNDHITRCTTEYLFSTTIPLQVEHAHLLIKSHPIADRESAIALVPDLKDNIVRATIYTGNYSGLVAHTIGVLTEAGYSIVTLKVFPYGESGLLMVVWFHLKGRALTEDRRLKRIKARLNSAISKRFINFVKPSSPPIFFQEEPPKILFDNTVSKRATVIEIRTLNRRGLLFDLVLTLTENRLQIFAAKIDTVGQRAMDVFYVCDRFGHKIFKPEYQQKIYQSLKARITASQRT